MRVFWTTSWCIYMSISSFSICQASNELRLICLRPRWSIPSKQPYWQALRQRPLPVLCYNVQLILGHQLYSKRPISQRNGLQREHQALRPRWLCKLHSSRTILPGFKPNWPISRIQRAPIMENGFQNRIWKHTPAPPPSLCKPSQHGLRPMESRPRRSLSRLPTGCKCHLFSGFNW